MARDTITVRVVGYGKLKERFGGDAGFVLHSGETVDALLQSLVLAQKLSEDEARCAAVAVDHEYVKRDALLDDGDEVAILPPVSGGSAAKVALVREPIETVSVQEEMKAPENGAVCVFDGIVRDNTRGRRTLHLDYEAYEEMALRQMQALRVEAVAKFGVREVAIVHRLGRLLVGETSVLIVVASAHRAAAFEACRWVIDTLKTTVPIWKREQFVDGAVWSDGEPFPQALTGKSE